MALALGLLVASTTKAGVTVQLTPATLSVAPNSEFEVKLRVISAGSPFNAFKGRIFYDAAMLTPVQISPLRNQIDSLFAAACSNTFHKFRFGAGRDSIDLSMLCDGASVTGPGPLYRLRFRAGSVTGRTGLAFAPDFEFANAGIYVTPVLATGAVIGIGVPVLDAGRDAGAATPSLTVVPNPVHSACRVEFGAPLSEASSLHVYDAQGREVMRASCERGASSWTWNGRGGDGGQVGVGLYFVHLRTGALDRVIRFVRVR